MRTRIATPDDEIAVSELLLASYPALMAREYDARQLAAALPRMVRANPLLLTSGTFYVVEGPNSSVIGCGGWTFEAPSGVEADMSGIVAHLRHFATHPNFVRRGVGGIIFDRCRDAAKSAGATRFQACSSRNAVPFYSSVGLEPVREFDLVLDEGVTLPAVLMEGVY